MFLEVENLTASYGRLKVLHSISLSVGQGEIVALIGANGAGKTTTLSSIMGLMGARTGTIRMCGKELGNSTQLSIKAGISMVAENRELFGSMTVKENMLLGTYPRIDKGQINADIDRICEMFPIIRERWNQQAGTLSGGQQQMLAIGRALMSSPKLLMMDEPSMGLAPLVVKEIYRSIGVLRDEGLTFLLVEQNSKLALSVADRGYVLEGGRVAASGTASELLADATVKDAYLGTVKA